MWGQGAVLAQRLAEVVVQQLAVNLTQLAVVDTGDEPCQLGLAHAGGFVGPADLELLIVLVDLDERLSLVVEPEEVERAAAGVQDLADQA